MSSKNTSLLESHNIVNFYGIVPSDIEFNSLQEKYKKYNIQIWLLFLDKEFKKLSSECLKYGFYPYCIGKLYKNLYIIFRKERTSSDNLFYFLKYYDSIYLNKNILILNSNILYTFRKYILDSNEISGFLKYDPLLVYTRPDGAVERSRGRTRGLRPLDQRESPLESPEGTRSDNRPDGAVERSDTSFSWKYVDKLEDSEFKIGDKDSAGIIYDKITFHTHPIPTYKIKKVKVAWPSVEDYMAVAHIYNQKKVIVYHIVISKEGLYIILCKGQVSEKNIKDKMDIKYNLENISLFLEKINKVSDNIQTKFYNWKTTTNIFIL